MGERRKQMDAEFEEEARNLLAGMTAHERRNYDDLVTRRHASDPVVKVGLARWVKGMTLSPFVMKRTRPYLPREPEVRTLSQSLRERRTP